MAKETKRTLLEVRKHPTFLETSISKYDFGSVKLPGLSRSRSLILEISGFGGVFQVFGESSGFLGRCVKAKSNIKRNLILGISFFGGVPGFWGVFRFF